MENEIVYGYKNLIVWNKSMDLVVAIYELTEKFPKSELYGLTSQMRRCAVSIPSNIVEGSKRRTQKDFRQFLIVSYSSGSELETQIEIVKRLPFSRNFDCQKIDKLLDEIMRMLNKMLSNFKNSNS